MTVLDFLQKPFGQLILFIGITLLALLAIRTRSAETLWTTAGIIYALFILENAIFIWKAPQPWTYFFLSIGLSILYILLVSGIMAAYEALVDLQGSGESAMIFLVIIYHPFALLLVLLAKWIFTRFF